jgi:hypothetical protein
VAARTRGSITSFRAVRTTSRTAYRRARGVTTKRSGSRRGSPFLSAKAQSAEEFEGRKAAILGWIAQTSVGGRATADPAAAAEAEIDAVIAAYDAALARIRAARPTGGGA